MREVSKLDADLARVLEVYDPDEEVPVIVYVSEGISLDTVRRSLAKAGRIRCSLDRINAVSAWVRIRSLPELAAWDLISALEMAQPVQAKNSF